MEKQPEPPSRSCEVSKNQKTMNTTADYEGLQRLHIGENSMQYSQRDAAIRLPFNTNHSLKTFSQYNEENSLFNVCPDSLPDERRKKQSNPIHDISLPKISEEISDTPIGSVLACNENKQRSVPQVDQARLFDKDSDGDT